MLCVVTGLAKRLKIERLIAAALAARSAMMDDELCLAMTALAFPARSREDVPDRRRRRTVAPRDAGPLPAMLDASAALDERPASGLRTHSHGYPPEAALVCR